MKSIIKQMRKWESSLDKQKAGIDHELTALRNAIDVLGGKIVTVKSAKVKNYSHKPWTAERRKRFNATLAKKKLLVMQKKTSKRRA